MVAIDKDQAGKDNSESSATQWVAKGSNTRKAAGEGRTTGIEENLSRAKDNRQHAENAREKITAEIMEATKRLYQTLIEEGEQTLDRAKQLEADSELKLLESQRELKHAQDLKTEADSYRMKVIAQTRQQSQDMLHEAQTIKADAVAFRENVLSEVKRQSDIELAQAQLARVEVDNYREQVISETQRQSEEMLQQARLSAHHEGAEIRQKYSIEAEKLLAQAEIIKEAAQEELEAQRLYSQAASLESESKEVLNQARAKISNVPLYHETPDTSSEPAEANEARQENLTRINYSNRPSTQDITESGRGPTIDFAEGSYDGKDDGEAPERKSMSSESPTVRVSKPAPKPAPKVEPSEGSTVESLLPSNELVLGLEINDQSKAYPMNILSQQRVINDNLAGVDLLITVAPPSELGMMFNRRLDGKKLYFEPIPETDNGIALMKDLETGTNWEILTGKAVKGSLSGRELERMHPEYSFWFAWSQLHPKTEVYQQY